MKACVLHAPAPIESNPLAFENCATPRPGKGEVLVRVHACGVCRTDLHVIEGELPPRKSPVIPGHQVVGMVEKQGESAGRFAIGDRVGIAWLYRIDGICEYCKANAENLCDNPMFTGYSVDGGYAEYIVAPQDLSMRFQRDFSMNKLRRCFVQESSGSARCGSPVFKRVGAWAFMALAQRLTWR